MRYRWIHRDVSCTTTLQRLCGELNALPEALGRALMLRGVETFDAARSFFRPSRDLLHSPLEMADMDAAVERLSRAISQGERVLIYGDYDVDGTTATALLVSFLRSRTDVSYFIPDRYQDGYGLNVRGIDHAADIGASLIIAVDCGITAIDEAQYARERGIDLIICDHHTPKPALPECTAVIDPKRTDCRYPFKELSGCGIAFKLVIATLEALGESTEEAYDYLDLVALSTASDIVPMVGENRILMAEGLACLGRGARPGIRQLAELAGVDLATCSTSRIVFGIGPRINAAGRLGHASLAVDLLLAEQSDEAAALARQLEELNQQRRTLDAKTAGEALKVADRQITSGMPHALVLYDPEWHLGVIGIVASRIVEQYYRPAVMLTSVDGEIKGSARSITGLNIYEALKACEDLLTQFGGHDYAAGLSLPEQNLPEFRKRLNEVVGGMIEPDMLTPAIDYDARLEVGEISPRLWAILRQFEPFGPENPTPVFHASALQVVGRPRLLGKSETHLKFRVRDLAGGSPEEVIGFNMANRFDDVAQSSRHGKPLELLYSIEENHWNGRTTLQLRARDLRLSNPSD